MPAAESCGLVHLDLLWSLALELTPDRDTARRAVLDTAATAAADPAVVGAPDAEAPGRLAAILVRAGRRAVGPVIEVGRGPLLGEATVQVAVLRDRLGLSEAMTARVLGRRRSTVAAQHGRARAAGCPGPPPPPEPAPESLRRAVADGAGEVLAAPRRPSPGLLVGAGVVVALLVVTATVLLTPGMPPPQSPLVPAPAVQLPRAIPPPSVAAARADSGRQLAAALTTAAAGLPASADLLLSQHLARCVGVLTATGTGDQYPPPATWRAVRLDPGPALPLGLTTVVNDAFVCTTTPARAVVSRPSEDTVGGVRLLGVGADVLAVANPDGATVSVGVPGVPNVLASASPLVLVPLTGLAPSQLSLTVRRGGLVTYDGAVPEPAEPLQRLDVPMTPPDLPGPGDVVLQSCLAGSAVPDRAAWRTRAGLRRDDGSQVRAARARGVLGLCVEGSDQLVTAVVADPLPDSTLEVVLSVTGAQVLSVDERAVRLVVAEAGAPGDLGPRAVAGVECVVGGGIGLCLDQLGGSGGSLLALDAAGAVVAGPVRR